MHVAAYDFAMVYAGLEDNNNAFLWLRKAAEQRESALANINVHPRFAGLRADPRFAELQQQLGLSKH